MLILSVVEVQTCRFPCFYVGTQPFLHDDVIADPFIQTDHSVFTPYSDYPDFTRFVHTYCSTCTFSVFTTLGSIQFPKHVNHFAALLLIGPIIDMLPGRVETPRMTQSLEKLSLAAEEGMKQQT